MVFVIINLYAVRTRSGVKEKNSSAKAEESDKIPFGINYLFENCRYVKETLRGRVFSKRPQRLCREDPKFTIKKHTPE